MTKIKRFDQKSLSRNQKQRFGIYKTGEDKIDGPPPHSGVPYKGKGGSGSYLKRVTNALKKKPT